MINQISKELNLRLNQVENLIELLDQGATIPFIARYRKEATSGLDEVQIRDVRDRYEYLTELNDRKATVLDSIKSQEKLTPALEKQIIAADTKQKVEDLYAPYKPKRRTRAQIARELGLEPLALVMKAQEDYIPWLAAFPMPEGLNELEVLAKARDIIAEEVADEASLKETLRHLAWSLGEIKSTVRKEFKEEKTKFSQYYEHQEAVKKIPAHRFLAIRRGEEEKILRLKFELPEESMVEEIQKFYVNKAKGNDKQLLLAIDEAFSRLILTNIEVEIRLDLKERSDEDSIKVFGQNLRDLLLASPAGAHCMLGIDPGFRTGSKFVVINAQGKLMDHGTIYPVPPQNKFQESEAILLAMISKYKPRYVCIGNGTAGREVLAFVKSMIKKVGLKDITPVSVNESGASIYSASDIAREEFPDLDLTFRGSVSIARRFQDPLAELVKIDPKSIGVGQYQHDVNQRKLKSNLDEVVESAVNHVGVDVNLASAPLLSYVSGMSATLAQSVVTHRNINGPFPNRKSLIKVERFGPKAFEQAAGFLRISGGDTPLDSSAVHPENYTLVDKIAKDLNLKPKDLLQNKEAISKIKPMDYVSEQVGILTLKDITEELLKPGRDPRESYVGAELNDDVNEMTDLEVGMQLEGTVTNMTKFGCFVDIGVHQDGLVHISELADHFIKDPSEVTHVGQVLKVTVLEVEASRGRISLSAKSKPSTNIAGVSNYSSSSAKPKKAEKKEKEAPATLASLQAKFGRL
ncbi:MAG: Tex family protein [SAR324 cluster bacterium]|nr:Tex family protein [SAR324 cluster bacterium]